MNVNVPRHVFLIAEIDGLLVIAPLSFLESFFIGQRNPPPVIHPEFVRSVNSRLKMKAIPYIKSCSSYS